MHRTVRAYLRLSSASIHNLDIKMAQGKTFIADKIAAIEQAYRAPGGDRSNITCGYIARKTA